MRLFASLTNRIFLASSLLALMSIGVAIYVVNAAVTAQAEAELARGLEEAGGLVEHYRNLLLESFTRQARLVADLPKLKAAVALDHSPTVQPLVDDYRAQMNADLLLITNREGKPLAATAAVRDQEVAALPAIRRALERQETTFVWARPEEALQVVTVPIWIGLEQVEILGTLTVGFNLDQPLTERFKRLTDSEIAFTLGGEVLAATLPALSATAVDAISPASGIQRVTLAGEDFVAIGRPLADTSLAGAPGRSTPGGEAPSVVILRSRSERLRFLGALQTALVTTAIVALFAATLLSYAVARTITRPLGAIVETMREMGRTGDLTRKIPPASGGGWKDEDAQVLATTFNAMTESIARFQREAAQRERLSSLGRLSTIVAHEIRNPLMIIKASLRTLRRSEDDPARARAAVEDIDEEVRRLNRLVSEVLDFARPIRFDYAPADLNAICREAAAAHRMEGGLPIALSLDPTVCGVITDADRLRLALVNLITNANHAVQERAARAGDDDQLSAGERSARVTEAAEPDVELRTERLSPDRFRIVVRDSGVGMTEEELGRIWEPYFTTKRTGSGLGLAIVRNVVEGLGGTIAATSQAGHGTEIRLELPAVAPGAAAPVATGAPWSQSS